MKKWMFSLVMISLIAVSTFVLYKEGYARPMLCDTMEYECYLCSGTWVFIWCEETDTNHNGWIDCQFCCFDLLWGPFCDWWPADEFCGMCVM